MQNARCSRQTTLLKQGQGSECSTWLCSPTAASGEPRWLWATASSQKQRTLQRTALLSNRGQYRMICFLSFFKKIRGLNQGSALFLSLRCLSSSETAEVVIADSTSKVYRLDLSKTTSVAPMVCRYLGSLINGIRNGLHGRLFSTFHTNSHMNQN